MESESDIMHAPRHRFQREETMARSHQRGTIRLEHKSWVGYLNLKVLDPNTGESKWKKQPIRVERLFQVSLRGVSVIAKQDGGAMFRERF